MYFMGESREKQIKEYLYKHIPISQAMGIEVQQASLDKVALFAPIANNINHKSTVFGGSLHAVATLACWSLLYLHVKKVGGKPPQIVITKSEILYHAPVEADFIAECVAPESADLERFLKMLQAKGKARIHLAATISDNNRVCVEYQASFAALRSNS